MKIREKYSLRLVDVHVTIKGQFFQVFFPKCLTAKFVLKIPEKYLKKKESWK